MNTTSTDRLTLAQNVTFTGKVQILGTAQAKTIVEETRSNPSGDLISGVTFADAAPFAERFLSDQGLWAGKLALAIVNDSAIDALFTGSPAAYPALTGVSPDPWDGPIANVLPYVFAAFVAVE